MFSYFGHKVWNLYQCSVSCIALRYKFDKLFLSLIANKNWSLIRHHSVVSRVPAFQPGGPGLIPSGVMNFNFCPGIGCVSFVCILSCVVFGRDPDIVLTTYSGRPALVYLSSILLHRLLLPLQASDPRAFGLQVPGGVSPRLGEGKYKRRRSIRKT